MNEKIRYGQEMELQDMPMRQVIIRMMEHALGTRPEKQVVYRPFQVCKGVGFTRTLGSQKVELYKIYPDAAVGEGVVSDFSIRCEKDETIFLNVSPNVKVWYEGNCIYDGIGNTIDTGERLSEDTENARKHLPVHVKKGSGNPVRILCVKEEKKEFGYEFLVSVKRYPEMWANDYLFGARITLPLRQREEEEGIAFSDLMPYADCIKECIGRAKINYRWPEITSRNESFDFLKLCGDGDICYVYTEAETAHTLRFSGTVESVLINGKRTDKISFTENQGHVTVDAEDKILFRCRQDRGAWNLSLDTERLRLSFLVSHRGAGDRAIFAGPFYGRQCHAPEYEWDFAKVFQNQKGKKLYWRFCDGSELRIYLESVFWGQWFYALMVGFYGIRDAAIILEDRERQRLFNRNMGFLARYFEYIEFDLEKHVMSAFMPRIHAMNVLDNIGTMGMNLIDSYLDSNDRALLPVIQRIRYQMEETVPRMSDGTFCRVDTMWADDLFMSCPFLIRMGKLTGDKIWYEKAAKQIRGFKKYLYIQDEALFSHIYFPEKGVANHVPWGRGNGWVMWTLSEILMYGENEADLRAEKELFAEMAEGIRKLQDVSGLWHQVLNCCDEGSYLETSCTGMFMLAFVRGVKYGWLKEDFMENIERAWRGLLRHSIDKEGNIYGVCMGSGCALNAEYYFTIPTVINDDHGTGVVLAAVSEYYALQKGREGNDE